LASVIMNQSLMDKLLVSYSDYHLKLSLWSLTFEQVNQYTS